MLFLFIYHFESPALLFTTRKRFKAYSTRNYYQKKKKHAIFLIAANIYYLVYSSLEQKKVRVYYCSSTGQWNDFPEKNNPRYSEKIFFCNPCKDPWCFFILKTWSDQLSMAQFSILGNMMDSPLYRDFGIEKHN